MPASTETRIALFSDVHGNLAALRAVAAALDQESRTDHVVVAGDLLQGGPHPLEVWQMLRSQSWTLIRGNEDEALLPEDPPDLAGAYRHAFKSSVAWTRSNLAADTLTELAALPDQWRLATSAGDLLVVHASPRSISDRVGGTHNSSEEVQAAYAGTGAAVIAFGHYHRSFVRLEPFALLINVASVGLPPDRRPLASYTIVTATDGGWVVEQRQVPYDPAPEAAAAAERGMPPWVPDPDC
jgi:predicted phosphodiesterase